MDEFTITLNSNDIDVAAVTESKFSNELPTDSGLCHIPGYQLLRKDRSLNGGGVAVYAKEHLQCSAVNYVAIPDSLEVMWLKISSQKARVYILLVFTILPNIPIVISYMNISFVPLMRFVVMT